MDFEAARPTHAADDIGASVKVLQATGQEVGQQSRCLQAEDDQRLRRGSLVRNEPSESWIRYDRRLYKARGSILELRSLERKHLVGDQIYELGNSLAFITGQQLSEYVNNPSLENEPGNPLLNCYNFLRSR
jgi:hypothetical protein